MRGNGDNSPATSGFDPEFSDNPLRNNGRALGMGGDETTKYRFKYMTLKCLWILNYCTSIIITVSVLVRQM